MPYISATAEIMYAPFDFRLVTEIPRWARDFACGLPLRSRPQTGATSRPRPRSCMRPWISSWSSRLFIAETKWPRISEGLSAFGESVAGAANYIGPWRKGAQDDNAVVRLRNLVLSLMLGRGLWFAPARNGPPGRLQRMVDEVSDEA